MTPPDLNYHLGEIRSFTDRYKAGTDESFLAVESLFSKILGLTVLHPTSYVRRIYSPDEPGVVVIGGPRGVTDPLRLTNDRYLHLSLSLYIEDTQDGPRLKVRKSGFQYQTDQDGECWIFRYDYLRRPEDVYAAAHLQIRANLIEDGCLPYRVPLKDVHFPSSRVSLEAIIRLLIDDFGVPCRTDDEGIWRRVLSESERPFLEIAHRPTPHLP